jgi:O-antigen/teichoic acid export membrane protein
MLVVMSGTAVAQVIGFAMMPIISRLFAPSDFGIFGSFNSVLCVAGAVVTLQYSLAIMLPKEDSEAANVFAVSMLSVFVITLVGLFLAYVFSDWLLGLLKAPDSKWLLWFLPFGIFVSGINQSFQAWCIRRKAFKKTSSSQMIRAGVAGILQIISGLFHRGGGGLIAASVAANGIASLNLAGRVFCTDKDLLKSSLAWNRIRRLAFEYRDFPLYSATQNMTNALSQGLPVLLLSHFYGIAVAGAYAFGVRIVQVPFDFVLTAFRQVLFQKASEAYNQRQNLWPLFLKTTLGFAVISLPLSILFFFGAPKLFAWVFGEQWRMAGVYAGWLILWLMVGFCNLPSVLFARILRKQKQLFIYEFVTLIFCTASLFIGGLYFKAYTTVILFSVVGMLANSILIGWMACVVKHVNNNSE